MRSFSGVLTSHYCAVHRHNGNLILPGYQFGLTLRQNDRSSNQCFVCLSKNAYDNIAAGRHELIRIEVIIEVSLCLIKRVLLVLGDGEVVVNIQSRVNYVNIAFSRHELTLNSEVSRAILFIRVLNTDRNTTGNEFNLCSVGSINSHEVSIVIIQSFILDRILAGDVVRISRIDFELEEVTVALELTTHYRNIVELDVGRAIISIVVVIYSTIVEDEFDRVARLNSCFLYLNEDSVLSLRVSVVLIVDSEDSKGIFLSYVEISEFLALAFRSQQTVDINRTCFVNEVEVAVFLILDIGYNTGEDASIFGILESDELGDCFLAKVLCSFSTLNDFNGATCSKFGSCVIFGQLSCNGYFVANQHSVSLICNSALVSLKHITTVLGVSHPEAH